MRRIIDFKRLVVLVVFVLAGFYSLSSLTNQTEKKNASVASVPSDGTPDGARENRIIQDYGKLPLRFEKNLGQTDEQVRFLARGKGYALFLTGTETVLALRRASDAEQKTSVSDVVRVQLAGSNANPEVTGQDVLPGKSNYLVGNDQSKWRTNVANYKKVAYKDVYAGIDLVYYGTESGQLEHDFVVSPGINPEQIRFSMKGAEHLRLDATGNLIVSTLGGDITFLAPVTYQDIDDMRQPVESKYVLLASAEDVGQMVGFELGTYDDAHPVVIDPVLSYSTYLGGSNGDNAWGVALDGSGNAYITGSTSSTDLPTASAYDNSYNGGFADAFVTKFNSAGSALVYSTYLGGNNTDIASDIVVDGSGNVHITGNTQSSDFPTASPYQATHGGGATDAFVTKLNSTGSTLLYATYLGGGADDSGTALTLDGSGNVYVTGNTQSSNFPTASPYQATYGGNVDAFVTKLNSAGSALVYSTYLGGSNQEQGFGIALDNSGNAYLTGLVMSSDFPTVSPYQASHGGGSWDSYVTKLNSAGSALVYSTYLGGSTEDRAQKIAVDASGNAFIVGYTNSSNFPTVSPYQATYAGGSGEGFVTKMNSGGSPVYSTYLGGTGDETAYGVAVDALGNVFVVGTTSSTDFPTTASANDQTHNGNKDIFLTVLNSAGSALDYSTYFGDSNREEGTALAIDGSGNVVIAGWTSSVSFPTQSPYQATFAGVEDVILAKFTGFATPPTTLGISISDTVATYDTQILVPIRIEDPTTFGVVAAEISVTFDNSVVTLGSPDKTNLTGTLVASGWSVEENVFSGVGGIDTLTIAMSTAADTLLSAGDLVRIVLNVANTRHPDSTPLELVSVLFNDGTPPANSTNGSLTLIGTDGSIVASPDSVNPANVVSVTITDADFDVDVGSADQVSATAISKLYGDTQTISLTETGINTGIFTGTVNTAFALIAGPSEDGVIGTIAGDSICVSYVDSLDSAGITLARQDTVEVVGGVDGVVAVSYVVQAFDGRNSVRDTVRVQVADADLDVDVGVAEQVSATITNAISGEVESVTLTETGVNTGVFQIRVPSIAGASGTNNDGELSLASWDTLNVNYTDNLTAQGGVSPISKITRVINVFGDVQPNDQIQAFDAARLLAISVGLVSSNTQTTLVGDVDGNNVIQAFDASKVLQYVVRLIDRFGVQTDFTDDPKNHPFEKPALLGNVIALGNLKAQGDGTFLLPVSLGEREGILSGTLTLGMDAGIEVVDVGLANDYGSFMVAHNMTDEGLKIAFAGSQSELSGSGDVLTLKVRGVEGSLIRLSLDNVVLNGQTLTPQVNIEAMEEVLTQASELITQLHQNMPNPFNPETTIRYTLAEAGQIQVVIYSVTGQRVRTLLNKFQDSGSYQIIWDGKDGVGRAVSSGVYLMQMDTGSFLQTRRMMLLK